MKEIIKRGATSNILRVFLQDSASASGAGKTGLTNASSGLIISTIADLEATATTYTSAASNVETITTLGTFAAPSSGKCRFKEIDSTNFPGVYEIQIADARFNVSNATQLLISIQCTGVAPVFAEFQLIAVDLLDTVRLGLTAIPNVAQGTSGALPTGNATGQVTVATNNDKTGYSLTTTPPTATSIADAVWGADKDTPYGGGNYGNTTFGRRVLRGASTQADVSVTGSNHVAADIHELQPAVISAGDFSAGAIDANALATDAVTEIAQGILTEATSTTTYAAGDVGNILGRLHNMIEADGVDFRYTTNSLEQAWQLNAAQTTGLKRMITAIVGIGGETATPGVLEFGMVGDTTTLQITQSVDGNDRLTVQEI